MALDPQLRGQLQQTTYFAHLSSVTGAGVPSYGSTTAVASRVELDNKEVRGPDGAMRSSSHRIVIDAGFTPALTDRIWLPGDPAPPDTSKVRQPLSIQKAVDEKGAIDHWEILV